MIHCRDREIMYISMGFTYLIGSTAFQFIHGCEKQDVAKKKVDSESGDRLKRLNLLRGPRSASSVW